MKDQRWSGDRKNGVDNRNNSRSGSIYFEGHVIMKAPSCRYHCMGPILFLRRTQGTSLSLVLIHQNLWWGKKDRFDQIPPICDMTPPIDRKIYREPWEYRGDKGIEVGRDSSWMHKKGQRRHPDVPTIHYSTSLNHRHIPRYETLYGLSAWFSDTKSWRISVD